MGCGWPCGGTPRKTLKERVVAWTRALTAEENEKYREGKSKAAQRRHFARIKKQKEE